MVKMPSEILAGTALTSNQKETQERMTTRTLGIYVPTT
jgi:hypothetical protein